jgi:phage repressor protein C with HTH and peptisase S24 domain
MMTNFLKAWREHRGLTQEQLGVAIGTGKTQISRLERAERRLTLDWMLKLSAALGVEPGDLTHAPPGSDAMPLASRNVMAKEAAKLSIAASEMQGAMDLSVYASAQGGPTGMLVTPEPIEWITRPPPLVGVTRGFAVYVVNDSMDPAYCHGDMAYVHPGVPPRRGDDVLIYRIINGEWAAMIKKLTGWNEKTWKVRQHNPSRDFSLSRQEWPHLNVIVGRQNRR